MLLFKFIPVIVDASWGIRIVFQGIFFLSFFFKARGLFLKALKISLGGTLLSVFKLPGFLTEEQSLRVRAGSYSGVAPGSVSFIVGAQYVHEWIFFFFFFSQHCQEWHWLSQHTPSTWRFNWSFRSWGLRVWAKETLSTYYKNVTWVFFLFLLERDQIFKKLTIYKFKHLNSKQRKLLLETKNVV